ncbi:MAG: LamG-like jellyroll fold domain-containing protein, partial [Prevotellaceae bacterium]|nr:LamG-like jellyroll fold domain-containing protein [Prevotellaceae bacterium]
SYNTLQKKVGTHSLKFDGTNNYLLLPSTVGDMSQTTISFWAYNSSSTTARQRFFDFGNDDKHYMYLTPNNGSSMCFAIRNGDEEQTLTAPKFTTFGWHHFAVTMPSRYSQAEHDSQVSLYIDGELVASSTNIILRPSDIHSVRNYVGRSQTATAPLFKGYLDEIRIYNYALSASEIAVLAGKEVLFGDANNDGIVNVNDITLTAAYILDNSLTNINKVAADSNKDGIINVNDITTTAKIILNLMNLGI